MSERRIQWSLIGTSALFGSLSTIVILKLISRWSTKKIAAKKASLQVSLPRNGNVSGPGTVSGLSGMSCNAGMNDLSGIGLLEDEVASKHLTRNVQFFGMESQQRVVESFVVIVGLGGVGSHAAFMLLRSGVGRLLLVDFDQVSLSSLKRHAVATRADVGTPKAMCPQKHFSLIFPECRVEAKVQLYDASSEEEILSGRPDFALDCIDNIDAKTKLNREGIYKAPEVVQSCSTHIEAFTVLGDTTTVEMISASGTR